jgi:glycosyltransferase involved in cell wall biosynthesis
LKALLGIVVPVYRNAETLGALAERTRRVMCAEGLDCRLLFVVDGSPDASWDVVQRIAAEDRRVSGLRLSRNYGQHAAILAGLDAIEAEWVAVMDADLQDPPEVLPAMIRLLEANGGAVFGRRRGRYQSRMRMWTSRGFKTLLSWITGVPADVGTYLVMDARTADAIRGCAVRSPQIVVLAHHFARTTAFVPFDRPARADGTSAYSAAGRLRAAVRSVRCAIECRQLPAADSLISSSRSRFPV